MIDMSNNDGFCLLDGRIVVNCEHENCEDCEIYQDYVKNKGDIKDE